MSYSRFAVYYVPPEGPLAEFGAAWLGWDVARGREAAPNAAQVVDPALLPDLPDREDITMTPRKYGFHATLKPPFRLRASVDAEELTAAVSRLAGGLAPARCAGLELAALGRFLALVPKGDAASIARVAEACVRDLDGFREPPTEAELARRRKAGLSARQDALLDAWGYPYVMEEFRFHMTLTGRLPKARIAPCMEALHRRLPDLPRPFGLNEIALCGERSDGQFELIQRYALAG